MRVINENQLTSKDPFVAMFIHHIVQESLNKSKAAKIVD